MNTFKRITKEDFLRALQRAVYKTFYKYIVERTPGKGIVADEWDVITENDNVIIINKLYGNIVRFLEFGTGLYGPKKRKYWIEPVEKEALRFKVGPGDMFAFSKGHFHPGIKARKFITKIMENKKINQEFEKEFEVQLKRIFEK